MVEARVAKNMRGYTQPQLEKEREESQPQENVDPKLGDSQNQPRNRTGDCFIL